jgi:quercetin dioxygenase-like cupin family protein
MSSSDVLRVAFSESDPIRRGRISSRTAELPGLRIVEVTLAPGAKWSTDAAPFAGTALCERPHDAAVISGELVIQLKDQEPQTLVAGDVFHVPAGHDAWCASDEPCIFLEIELAASNP